MQKHGLAGGRGALHSVPAVRPGVTLRTDRLVRVLWRLGSQGIPMTGGSSRDNRYAVDGERNVRARALEGTRRVEQAVAYLTGMLKSTRRVGRILRLRYHTRDQRFVWRMRRRRENRREGETEFVWRDIGARVPPEVRRSLSKDTVSALDGVERRMDMRQDGRAVLHVVAWLLGHGLRSVTRLVELKWEGGGQQRITWTFRPDGRMQRKGTWRTPQLPPPKYGAESDWLLGVVDGKTELGPYATSVVRDLVEASEKADVQLAQLAEAIRQQGGGVRLYRNWQRDTWGFRELLGAKKTRHLPEPMLGGRVIRMPVVERQLIWDAAEALKRRQGIRRLLRVIAELTEAAAAWPGGRWGVRGYEGEEQPAVWAVAGDASGVVGRHYGTGTPGKGYAVEERDEGGTEHLEEG